MPFNDQDLQEPTAEDEAATADAAVPNELPPPSTLYLHFRDLALDPLPNLQLRISLNGNAQTCVTDADGNVAPIQAPEGRDLRIEVQRFDGSYKLLEEDKMPPGVRTWNYISPQLVIETETQLHEGEPGTIEQSIPQATPADDGEQPGNGDVEVAQAATETATPTPAPLPVPATAPTPAPSPLATAPKPASSRVPAPAPAAKLPQITGGAGAPARASPQIAGRTAQGNPMVVLTQRVKDWWNSWSLASIGFGAGHGGLPALSGGAATPPKAPPIPASKVPYSPSMLPIVNALIEFATEQTTYDYGKHEGTASVVADMAGKKFKHAKNEKGTSESQGRCYQYVRIALTRAGVIPGKDFLANGEPAAVQASASQAGGPLLKKGFVDVTDEVPDARWAAAGDVIVYSWSDHTWELRKKKNGPNTPNHGHIDIRSVDTYISDFVPRPENGSHPVWFSDDRKKPPTYYPQYVNIHIYRKFYDPTPTCRIRAFLACIREFECQAEHDDAKRYSVLNTPLPGHDAKDKTFKGFDRHPWDAVEASKRPASTAAGAYQIQWKTWHDYLGQQYFPDLAGKPLFTPAVQDRMAVVIIEANGGLSYVRRGDLSSAVSALTQGRYPQWTSLPGGTENKNRKTVDGKPMDMTYLKSLFDKFLATELEKYGIGGM